MTAHPAGRVEVFKNGVWGTVCQHYWWDNQHGAANLCKQLGYAAGGTRYNAGGVGTGPINAGYRKCYGGEATIFDCALQAGRTVEDETAGCTHKEDAGLMCIGPRHGEVRLSAYPKGRVEIYNGFGVAAAGSLKGPVAIGWGTLCGTHWAESQEGADNVCRQLGYLEGAVKRYTWDDRDWDLDSSGKLESRTWWGASSYYYNNSYVGETG